MATAALGIVVVNYGSHDLLATNLSGRRLRASVARVVIVDNFSSKAERSAVRELAGRNAWDLLELDDNPGFGAGVNRGVARARELGCTSFLLLNPDAAVGPDVVVALGEQVERLRMTAVCPTIVDQDGRTVFQGAEFQRVSGMIRGCRAGVDGQLSSPFGAHGQFWLTGACLAIHEELWDRIGGFDERYFLYWEDVDLSYRIVQAGGELLVRTDLRAIHDEGGTQSSSSRAKSNLYYFYNCRNRLQFAARHLTRRQVLSWMVRTPAASWEILLRGGKRQLVHSPRPLLAMVTGSFSGLLLALIAVVRNAPDRRTSDHRGRRALTPWSSTGAEPAAGRRRRSVLVAHPGSELYGSDRVLLESVEALELQGWDVVVTVPAAGPLVGEIQARGARVVLCPTAIVRKSALRPLGMAGLIWDALRGLIPAARLVWTTGRDNVYVNTITIPGWIVLGKLLGRRVVCHVHEAERSASPFLRKLMAAPIRSADSIIVNSKFSLDVLADSAPGLRSRARVVYNAVIGPGQVVPARQALTGSVCLLFVGRLSPRKGPHVAVGALSELVSRGLDVRLRLLGAVFPGYEWYEQELRETVRAAGLDDRVDFVGFQGNIWPFLTDADIALVPSTVDEPFGNTAVETVLAARPLVVSATSGLKEAAAGYESAVSVPPGESAAMADAVETIVQHWAEYRAAALRDAERAQQRHAPARYQQEIIEIVSAGVRG